VKNSTIAAIRPEKIFITSNYSPLEIWPDDKALREAVEDRFTVVDARAWERRRNDDNKNKWDEAYKQFDSVNF